MIKDENLHSSIDYSELQKEAAKKYFFSELLQPSHH